MIRILMPFRPTRWALALCAAGWLAAADPAPAPLIAYQGRLVEGGVVVNGSRDVVFAIRDAGGTELWNSGTIAVPVTNGLYATVLGGTPMPAIPGSVLGRAGLVLRVSIAGQVLTPDVALVPGLQALRAWEAETVTGTVAVANGGTGATDAATARANLGLVVGTDVLSPTGSAAGLTGFPTLNQDTTGTAANVSGVVGVAHGGTGAVTAAGARANLGLAIGSDVLSPTGSAAGLTGFPTFNQDTTGTAANVSGTVTVAHGGTGATGLGVSRQPLLGNGTGAVTAASAPTTDDVDADAILGTSSDDRKGLVVQGVVGQSADLTQWQTSTGLAIASVGPGGAAMFAGTLAVGSTTAPASGVAFFNGNVGIGTNATTRAVGLPGGTAQNVGMERSTFIGAGGALTVNAATAGAASTDANGGNLVLAAGGSTGTGTSSVVIQAASAGATGSVDNAAATRVTVSGANTRFQHQYYASQYANGNSGAAATINLNNGNAQTIVLTANCTLTISNAQAGGRYLLVLIQDGTGSRTVTWPGTMRWSGGVPPVLTTTPNYKDIVTIYSDGTSLNASAAVNFAP